MTDSDLPKYSTAKPGEKVEFDLLTLFPESLETKNFFLSVGRFIGYYSIIEQALIVILHQYAKTEISIARAVFSNWRPDQTISALHKVLQVRKLRGPKIVELKAVLQQISIITKVRNDLVHLGPHWGGVEKGESPKFLSNALLAYSRKVKRQTPISAAILDQMYRDLVEISYRLFCQMIDDRPRVKNRVSVSNFHKLEHLSNSDFALVVMKLFRRAYPASRPPAWRYKQPAVRKRRRKSRAHHPTRAGPPRSSGG